MRLKRINIILLCSGLGIIFGLSACGNKEKYNGDSRVNYADLKLILDDYLDTSAPLVYNKYVIEAGIKDSAVVPNAEMPWNDIYRSFITANIQNEEYDKKYTVEPTSDSITNSMTLHYTALDPSLHTQKVSIITNNIDHSMRSLYFETSDPGWFTTLYQGILFIPNKTIQIKERKKSLFSSEKTIITTYKF